VSAVFDRPLSLGLSHGDVRRLQQLLNADPDTRIAESGPGSPGNETDRFGALTEAAVRKFQMKYGVVASPGASGYGVVGPATRAKLHEVFGAGAPATGAPAAPPEAQTGPSGAASPQAAIEQQLADALQRLLKLQQELLQATGGQ
jgi:peptidoglycan hydrolase-like protein with peptidoglycan-binding domain